VCFDLKEVKALKLNKKDGIQISENMGYQANSSKRRGRRSIETRRERRHSLYLTTGFEIQDSQPWEEAQEGLQRLAGLALWPGWRILQLAILDGIVIAGLLLRMLRMIAEAGLQSLESAVKESRREARRKRRERSTLSLHSFSTQPSDQSPETTMSSTPKTRGEMAGKGGSAHSSSSDTPETSDQGNFDSTVKKKTGNDSLGEKLEPSLARLLSRQPLPHPENYPRLLFDGENVTRWLEELERHFLIQNFTDQLRLQETPYYTKDKKMLKRLQAVIAECKTWGHAKSRLKEIYSMGDSEEDRSPLDQLRLLETRLPHLSSPHEIYDYVYDHMALCKEVAKEMAHDIPSDEKVRGFIDRLDGGALMQISSHKRCNYNDFYGMTYPDVTDAVKGWAQSRVYFGRHNRKLEPAREEEIERNYPERTQHVEKRLRFAERTETPEPAPTQPAPQQTSDSMMEVIEGLKSLKIGQMQIDHKLASQKQELDELRYHQAQSPYHSQPGETSEWERHKQQPPSDRRSFRANLTQVADDSEARSDEPAQGQDNDPFPPGRSFGGNRFYQRGGYSRGGGVQRGDRYIERSDQYRRSNGPCWACGSEGHTTFRCELLTEMYFDGVMQYNQDDRLYHVGGKGTPPNISAITIPSNVVSACRSDGRPIIHEGLQWVRSSGVGDAVLQKRVYLKLRKLNLIPEDEEEWKYLCDQVNKEHPEGPPTIHMNLLEFAEDTGEVLFPQDPVEDFEWDEHPPVVPGDTTDFYAIIPERSAPEPLPEFKVPTLSTFTATVDVLAATKRQMGPNGNPIERDSTDQPTPEGDLKPQNPQDKSAISQREFQRFWKDKITTNAQKNFAVTWEDLVRFCPGFDAVMAEFMASNFGDADKTIAEVIRLARSTQADHADAKQPSKTIGISALEMGPHANSREARNGLRKMPDKGEAGVLRHIRPLLRLPVRVGDTGRERLITGIIDTGAQASIISLDYVRDHGIPMAKSKMVCQGIGTGPGGTLPTSGVLETFVWLAGRSISVPMFVVEDRLAANPLILGLNFICQTKMCLYSEGENLIAEMLFGRSKIIVPVSSPKALRKSMSDIIDGSEKGSPSMS
jgi:hypothetical protein